MKNNNDETNIKSAVDYIEESALLSNDKYNWIKPLINKVLKDSIHEKDIESVIDELIGKEPEEKKEKTKSDEEVHSTRNNESNELMQLLKIDKMTNVGLIDIKNPIEFKSGMNVFFGTNGAGKSTLYSGICKSLGYPKRVLPNLESEDEISVCKLSYLDKSGKTRDLEWDIKNENTRKFRIKIFDSNISNYIVQQNQENRFEMAHLKMEVFSQLYDLFDNLEEKIEQEKRINDTELLAYKKTINDKASFLFDNDEFTIDLEALKTYKLSNKEREKLKKLNKKITTLDKRTTELLVKNLKNSLTETRKVLRTFGEIKQIENSKDKNFENLALTFTRDYFEKLNKKIIEYNETKHFINKQGESQVATELPTNWVDNPKWEEFIKKSIEFLDTLEDNTLEKYTTEKCIYCAQELQTEESKKLIKTYRELSENLEENLNSLDEEIQKYLSDFTKAIHLLEKIQSVNESIESGLEHIESKHAKLDNLPLKIILKFFKEQTQKIKQKKELEHGDTLQDIEKLWDIYLDIAKVFFKNIKILDEDFSNRKSKLEEYEKQLLPLENKKTVISIKQDIKKYLELKEQSNFLSEKISEISNMRQITSTIKTSFSNNETLKEFKRVLQNEYEALDFSTPSIWNIKPITRGGVNKRVYSIGDKQLSEIFSEGEQKIHSLADFFTQSQMENYKGVFIFDDPVNSLDEENIELVADRIKELTEQGNQVIVFTHNLYFLNALIDTSKDKVVKITRESNQVKLMRNLTIGGTQELKKILKKIKERFNNLDNNNPDLLDMRNIYDLISGYLESYVEKVYLKNIISRYRPNIRMSKLSQLTSIDKDKMLDISELFEKASRRGARHSQPSMIKKPTYTELKEDINTLEEEFIYH